MESPHIRPIVICLCSFENKILVFKDFDSVKKEIFYRPLGGGIEFGEYGIDAIQREFQEELEVDLNNLKYLFTMENIFTLNGNRGHEIVLVYDGQLSDASLYGQELVGHEDDENNTPFKAYWRSWQEISQEGYPLYPDGLSDILKEMNIFY